jgi:two-component system probable response regulator PhcQ
MAPMKTTETMRSGVPAGGTTILFVDDEEAVLRSIARILASSELNVLTATTPREAFELIATSKVDVVVSDIDMPAMDGLELLERVRMKHPRVLRMLLTGSATLDRALRAINEGEVARFFRKPFDVEIFRRSLVSLAHRIEAARAGDMEAERRQRALSLQTWVAQRFPHLLDDITGPEGLIEIDVERLRSALVRVADPQLRGLADHPAPGTSRSSAVTQDLA